MQAEIITIGEELLIGQTINSNAAWLATQLNELGITVKRIHTIGDEPGEITHSLQNIHPESRLVISTGGLGPTRDDLTRDTLCRHFNTELVHNDEVLEDIRALFTRRHLPLTALNISQALVPEGAHILRNHQGTAPGFMIESDNRYFVALPGVPYEMKHMFAEQLVRVLIPLAGKQAIVHKNLITQGIGESFLADIIASWEDQLPSPLRLAYLPSPGIVKLRISGKHESRAYLEKLIDDQILLLRPMIGHYLISESGETPAETTGRLLLKTKASLSLAESCTGGHISHLITQIAGCSEWFKGAAVVYHNQAKTDLLGILPGLIEKEGAVSEAVAIEMALGACRVFSSDYAIGISGIAGPGGGSAEKPVGMVCMAVHGPRGSISKTEVFGDHRERNIQRASLSALAMLIRYLADS